MKKELQQLIVNALVELQRHNVIPTDVTFAVQLERCRNKQHGDLACNIALILAKQLGRNPRELAQQIVDHLSQSDLVNKIDIAGPGFINFYLNVNAYQEIIQQILTQAENYGKQTPAKSLRIHLEFVSANPTGPLHVGHGRGAAYGAALADLLTTAGHKVHKEYYVNDAGRQMHILALSVWLRYLALTGEDINFPSNAYQGDYVIDIAKQLLQSKEKAYHQSADHVFNDLPEADDEEKYMDALIARAKKLLGQDAYQEVFNAGLNSILTDIRQDLADFGVTFDEWFREKNLHAANLIEQGIAQLKASKHTYERDGALWFRSTDFGDDKDRVLIRDNGQPTYFAADVAYHWHKYERGFDQIIDILGADHHGYAPRLKAVIKALDKNPDDFDVLLVQFAVLYRGKEKVQMSTRSGSFVTLKTLYNEVGKDAARFFYVMRKPDQHMDFDLELAKSQTTDNPVYYIQYAHARICSVFRQLAEKQLTWDQNIGLAAFSRLDTEHERDVLNTLSRYDDMICTAARNHDPHMIAHYLRELADNFHSYYNAHQFIIDDNELCQARLTLIAACQQVIVNGLTLLGVSAPKAM